MPKRIIDGEAMWGSTKLAACEEWARVEYAWLYPLADCNGSFEITSLRAIHARVSIVRPRLVLGKIQRTLEEYARHGLLYIWEENGKRYAHWTNSDLPGRLPKASDRYKYQKLAPPVPKDKLGAYIAQFIAPIAPQQGGNGAPDGAHGFGVGLGLGEGIGLGGGFGVGAPKIAALGTAAKPASASPPSEKSKSPKTKSAYVVDPDESLRGEAERQKAEQYTKFGKGK